MKKAFILCGLTGWCMEILWTGLHSILSGELTMTGKTSLLMFPIYGCGAIVRRSPVNFLLSRFFVRGCIYTVGFFFVEFISGISFTLFSYVSLGLQQHSSELPGTDTAGLRSPLVRSRTFF